MTVRIILWMNIFVQDSKWKRSYNETLLVTSSLSKQFLPGFTLSIHFHSPLWPWGPGASLGLEPQLCRYLFPRRISCLCFPAYTMSLSLSGRAFHPSNPGKASGLFLPPPLAFPFCFPGLWLLISIPLFLLSTPCLPLRVTLPTPNTRSVQRLFTHLLFPSFQTLLWKIIQSC